MQTVTQLYTLFQPEHYDLHLLLEREARTFSGTVTIRGLVTTSQNSLRLHAKDLEVTAATIDDEVATIKIDEKNDEVQLEGVALTSGTKTIKLTFAGKITDPMHGLYPCYYEHDGVKKELLATQCESHHAREVFPCIDEPSGKATFDVSLQTETGVEVLGNMPVASQQEVAGKLLTTFETSPKMSPYLLAFVVGELQYKEAFSKSGVQVRSWATKAQKPETLDFSVQFAADVIDFFDDYFGIAYPLPKADQVALPDFSSGAMENWGLVTYREAALLVDPTSTSVSRKQYIAKVIAHELSHQWFGNLVTMKWWDDLWLNESFASLMEYVALDALKPDWNVWLEFGAEDRVAALERDILPGVQAVHTSVSHPDEISTLFDPAIVYAKGAVLLRMLQQYIGEDAFRAGLKNYFQKYQYTNTRGAELWQAFTDATGQNIADFMTAWISKPGYPVLHVTQKDNKLYISQKRLLAEGEDTQSLWPVPLFAAAALPETLLTSRELDLELDTDDTDIRTINTGSAGAYVTHYTEKNQQVFLQQQFTDGSLPAVDRLKLLYDSLLLPQAGEASLIPSLELAFSATHEKQDTVWGIISMIIAQARRFVEHDKILVSQLKQRVQLLASPLVSELGFINQSTDNEETIKLRATIFALATWAEEPRAVAFALSEFDRFTALSDLAADTRVSIFRAGVKERGQAAYEKLFALYKKTQFSEERQALLAGMTSARDETIIKTLLSHITNPDVVRAQDVFYWFAYLIRQQDARQMTWDWMVENWQWIEEAFKSDKSYDSFPRYASAALVGKEWLTAFTGFFGPKRTQVALARNIEVGLQDIAATTAWFEREQNGLREYLSQNG